MSGKIGNDDSYLFLLSWQYMPVGISRVYPPRYDVYDYDNADDFADEWAEDFMEDGDYDEDEAWEEAYDYWEDHHDD